MSKRGLHPIAFAKAKACGFDPNNGIVYGSSLLYPLSTYSTLVFKPSGMVKILKDKPGHYPTFKPVNPEKLHALAKRL